MNQESLTLVVVGGGAAGFFASINAKLANPPLNVILVEGSRRVLTKVKVSGGGRCNVTHNCFQPKELIQYYPRGSKELLGAFFNFGPKSMVEWLKSKGIELKTEADGRMFPVSNSSQTIIDCLRGEAEHAGVDLRLGYQLRSIEKTKQQFELKFRGKESLTCDYVLIATGSAPIGYEIVSKLGHEVIDPVPSLFTFMIEDPGLKALAGLAFEQANLSLKIAVSDETKKSAQSKSAQKNSFQFSGPLLVTHWGLSGPAVLKLSAWAARSLYNHDYKAALQVDFLPEVTAQQVLERIVEQKSKHAKKLIYSSDYLFGADGIPKRFWQYLVKRCGIGEQLSWAHLTSQQQDELSSQLKRGSYQVSGKGVFKEEFVTCGGVSLKEVDFRTMQSKLIKGLFFAGELLDIDGITGGFNFQNAWTTSWIGAQAIADLSILDHKIDEK